MHRLKVIWENISDSFRRLQRPQVIKAASILLAAVVVSATVAALLPGRVTPTQLSTAGVSSNDCSCSNNKLNIIYQSASHACTISGVPRFCQQLLPGYAYPSKTNVCDRPTTTLPQTYGCVRCEDCRAPGANITRANEDMDSRPIDYLDPSCFSKIGLGNPNYRETGGGIAIHPETQIEKFVALYCTANFPEIAAHNLTAEPWEEDEYFQSVKFTPPGAGPTWREGRTANYTDVYIPYPWQTGQLGDVCAAMQVHATFLEATATNPSIDPLASGINCNILVPVIKAYDTALASCGSAWNLELTRLFNPNHALAGSCDIPFPACKPLYLALQGWCARYFGQDAGGNNCNLNGPTDPNVLEICAPFI